MGDALSKLEPLTHQASKKYYFIDRCVWVQNPTGPRLLFKCLYSRKAYSPSFFASVDLASNEVHTVGFDKSYWADLLAASESGRFLAIISERGLRLYDLESRKKLFKGYSASPAMQFLEDRLFFESQPGKLARFAAVSGELFEIDLPCLYDSKTNDFMRFISLEVAKSRGVVFIAARGSGSKSVVLAVDVGRSAVLTVQPFVDCVKSIFYSGSLDLLGVFRSSDTVDLFQLRGNGLYPTGSLKHSSKLLSCRPMASEQTLVSICQLDIEMSVVTWDLAKRKKLNSFIIDIRPSPNFLSIVFAGDQSQLVLQVDTTVLFFDLSGSCTPDKLSNGKQSSVWDFSHKTLNSKFNNAHIEHLFELRNRRATFVATERKMNALGQPSKLDATPLQTNFRKLAIAQGDVQVAPAPRVWKLGLDQKLSFSDKTVLKSFCLQSRPVEETETIFKTTSKKMGGKVRLRSGRTRSSALKEDSLRVSQSAVARQLFTDNSGRPRLSSVQEASHLSKRNEICDLSLPSEALDLQN